MRRSLLTALFIVAIAPVAYCLYFGWATSETAALVSSEGQPAGLAWVRAEFELNETEFTAVKDANASYMPRCEAMCMELARERKNMAALVEMPSSTVVELETAQAKVNGMEQHCFRMTLEHIYNTSLLMAPEKGARYRKHLITELLGHRINHHKMLSVAPRSGI